MNMLHAHENGGAADVAIVGAGLAGLLAAHRLAAGGRTPRLFDKARGPGGRMATRRRGAYAFDLGAQYFTVRSARIQPHLEAWIDQGVVARWNGRLGTARDGRTAPLADDTTRYVGTPRMSALTRYLATPLDVQYETRVARIERAGRAWRLHSADGRDLGTYTAVLVTTPPPQAVPLLAAAESLARDVQAVAMQPCWAVMAVFDAPLPVPFDGLFVDGAPVAWAARNNSKPGRAPDECWVLHGAHDWSTAHLETDGEAVAGLLLASFFDAAGLDPATPRHLQAHRWRYARAEHPLDRPALWDADLCIGAAGDGCLQGRVEGACLSGLAAADTLLAAGT